MTAKPGIGGSVVDLLGDLFQLRLNWILGTIPVPIILTAAPDLNGKEHGVWDKLSRLDLYFSCQSRDGPAQHPRDL